MISFIAAGTAIMLCFAGGAAGYFLALQGGLKSRKKQVKPKQQTQLELERIRASQEEYRNIARYDGTAQE